MPMYISTLFLCRNACIQSPLADSFVDYLTEWWMDWQLDGLRQRLYDGLIDGTMLFTYAIILQKYTPTHTHTFTMWIIATNTEYSCAYTGFKQNNTLYIYCTHILELKRPRLFFFQDWTPNSDFFSSGQWIKVHLGSRYIYNHPVLSLQLWAFCSGNFLLSTCHTSQWKALIRRPILSKLLILRMVHKSLLNWVDDHPLLSGK